MNFSIRTLLIVMASLSILFASFVYINPVIGDLYYSGGLLMVGLALIFAVYRTDSRRAFWVGFLILFVGYLIHTVWPIQLRASWLVFSNTVVPKSPQLITNRLLILCFQGLHDTLPSSLNHSGINKLLVDRYFAFLIVGHTAIGLILGICGGNIAMLTVARKKSLAGPIVGWPKDGQ